MHSTCTPLRAALAISGKCAVIICSRIFSGFSLVSPLRLIWMSPALTVVMIDPPCRGAGMAQRLPLPRQRLLQPRTFALSLPPTPVLPLKGAENPRQRHLLAPSPLEGEGQGGMTAANHITLK